MAKAQMRNRPACSTALLWSYHQSCTPKIRNFTTKPLSQNLKMSIRTQTPILSLRGANATLQSPSYNFTTKSLPLNLKMSNRTQTCDANVSQPAISILNHYHKTQKWQIIPRFNPHTCHCKKRQRQGNLHRQSPEMFFKTQSRPILQSPYPPVTQCHTPFPHPLKLVFCGDPTIQRWDFTLYPSLRKPPAILPSPIPVIAKTERDQAISTVHFHYQTTTTKLKYEHSNPNLHTCYCEEHRRRSNLHRPPPELFSKRKADPFYNRPIPLPHIQLPCFWAQPKERNMPVKSAREPPVLIFQDWF